MRGPSGPYATYVITCTPSLGMDVMRGSSTPAFSRTALPAAVGLEHDALAFDAHRHAVLDHDPCDADPRDVAGSDQPREQVQLPVGAASGRGIEHPLDFELVALLGRHDDPDSGESVRERVEHGHPFTPDPRSLERKYRWNTMNSATAGPASTTAPASTAPNGLDAVAATLLM